MVTRLEFSKRKAGLWLSHLGLIVLLAGQFFTEAFQRESLLRLEQGEAKNYSEDPRLNELAIIDTTSPERDSVFSIPAALLSREKEIRRAELPFVIRVKAYLPNSVPVRPGTDAADALKSGQGIGRRLRFAPSESASEPDGGNLPAACVEILGDKEPVGDWVVSTWLTKPHELERLSDWLNDSSLGVSDPQTFTYNGHSYRIELRPMRYYMQYSIELVEFRHDLYQGTEIAKNYSSLVHLDDPTRGENRDVVIRMNNPLRYRGETYYQSSFEPGGQVSILQVVRNPASYAPYVSCVMISLGLTIHFLMHLIEFRRRLTAQRLVALKQKESRS
jgi:hypothetical protein